MAMLPLYIAFIATGDDDEKDRRGEIKACLTHTHTRLIVSFEDPQVIFL